MQRLGTDIGSPGPWWGKEEKIESTNIPLMSGTGVSYNFGILANEDNPVSSVQASGNRNMSSALAG